MSHHAWLSLLLACFNGDLWMTAPELPARPSWKPYLLLMSLVRMGARRLKEDLAE